MLIIGFCIVISIIFVIVGYHGVIVIEIVVEDRSSPSPANGWKRRRSGCAVYMCHALKGRRVISMKK